MPDVTTDAAVLDRLLDQLATAQRAEDGLLGASSRIREAAHHDFSQFEYLLPPLTAARGPGRRADDLRGAVLAAVATGLGRVFQYGELDGSEGYRSVSQAHFDRITEADGAYDDAGMADKLMDGDLVDAAVTEISRHDGQLPSWSSRFGGALLAAFQQVLADEMRTWHPTSTGDLDRLIDDAGIGAAVARQAWSMAGQGWDGNGGFVPYAPGSVNFGLQTVYRQVWTPLGVQTGEIVRTLPLGPQQREKISITVTRRRQQSRSVEVSTSTEQSREDTSSSKDSQEIVDEAASSLNWNVSATGEYNTGFAKAKVSAQAGGEQSNRSSTEKSQLNESMSKSASKVRRDTKVVVSTESEQTFERATTSEISNPNDEIAVTYVYSKLQRQYEISTFLAQLNTVVFVAERVPSRSELTPQWFRKHAGVLADALLDDSFADDLRRVAWGTPPTGDGDIDQRVSDILDSYSSDLPDYSAAAGTPPDTVGSMALLYERELERRRQSSAEGMAFQTALARLRDHVGDNVLHYCRAIWEAEDPQMRLLRYAEIKVPTRWTLNYLDATYTSHMGYQPEITGPDSYELLSEIINPAGPIGFSGNYAVYYLKQRADWSDLLDLLAVMRQPYLQVVTGVQGPDGPDARAVASPNVSTRMRFRVRVAGEEVEVHRASDPARPDTAWNNYATVRAAGVVEHGGSLDFEHFRLNLDLDGHGPLADGTEFHVDVTVVPVLEDPELRLLRWTEPLPTPDVEAQVFDAATLANMRRSLPAVASAVADGEDWEGLGDEARDVVRDRYHEFLLHDRYTRRLLIDTDNVVLDRIVDDRSTLEPFKHAHRYLDVLSAAADVRTRQAEASRRQARLDAGSLGDPDTDRTVLVDADLDVDPSIDPTDG